LIAIRINGAWTDGYSLDRHTISSEYIGEDVYGNKQYKTVHTDVGELLYRLKYNGHHDTSDAIVEKAGVFLDEWLRDKKIDIVLPAPPTKLREIQPVFLIAEGIAKRYRLPYSDAVLAKNADIQAKDMTKSEKDMRGGVKLLKFAKRRCNILIVDDIYSTGSTLGECVRVLRSDKLVQDVYVFTVTKTG
jgi:predicted amidophosphoribosyltransferase